MGAFRGEAPLAGAQQGVSVTIGLLVTPALREVFRFLDSTTLPRVTVHTTCETCSIPDCRVRAAAPTEVTAATQLQLVQGRLKAVGSYSNSETIA
jgi:XRE family transcriptional regulator, fatty acid utilization regulator